MRAKAAVPLRARNWLHRPLTTLRSRLEAVMHADDDYSIVLRANLRHFDSRSRSAVQQSSKVVLRKRVHW